MAYFLKCTSRDEALWRLGLKTDSSVMTKAGWMMSTLGVSPRVAAMLWYSEREGHLFGGLVLASVMSVQGLRKNERYGHNLEPSSDWIDSVQAFMALYAVKNKVHRRSMSVQYNISLHKFREAKAALVDLKRRIGKFRDTAGYMPPNSFFRRCILFGFSDQLFSKAGQPIVTDAVKQTYPFSGDTNVCVDECFFYVGEVVDDVIRYVTVVNHKDILGVAQFVPHFLHKEGGSKLFLGGLYAINYYLFGKYPLISFGRVSRLDMRYGFNKTIFLLNTIEARLARLSIYRKNYNLSSVFYGKDSFKLGQLSVDAYPYTEEGLAKALKLHKKHMNIVRKKTLKKVVKDALSYADLISDEGVLLKVCGDYLYVNGRAVYLCTDILDVLSDWLVMDKAS